MLRILISVLSSRNLQARHCYLKRCFMPLTSLTFSCRRAHAIAAGENYHKRLDKLLSFSFHVHEHVWLIYYRLFVSVHRRNCIISKRCCAGRNGCFRIVILPLHLLNDICSTAVFWRKRSWLAHASKSRCIYCDFLVATATLFFPLVFFFVAACLIILMMMHKCCKMFNSRFRRWQCSVSRCRLLFTTTSFLSIIMTVLFSPQVVLLAEKIQQIDTERKSRRAAAKP